jgi:TctA family transporter
LTPQNQIFLAKSLQSLLLFVLVGLGGIMLYQNKFVGTFEDFATIFFWAFGLDITIDAVRQATKPRTG